MMVDAGKKWDYAIGLIKINNLRPSSEFMDLVKKEKAGEISTTDIKAYLDEKYLIK